MQLRRLAIRRFRLLDAIDLELGPGLTIVVGRNAQGKTSLLEAITYLVTGRSFRTRADAEVPSWGAGGGGGAGSAGDGGTRVAFVEGEVARRGGAATLRVVLGAEGGKRVFGDDKPLDRLGRLWGRFNAVLFTPGDLRLVQGGPALRRRFLDTELAQVDPAYLAALQRYDQALRQRNAVLRRGAGDPAREEATRRLLDAYRGELLEAGALLVHTRALALEALGREAARCHAAISGGAEAMALAYRPSITAGRGAGGQGAGGGAEGAEGAEAGEEATDDAGLAGPDSPRALDAPPEAAPDPAAIDRDALVQLFGRRLDARLRLDLRHRQTTVGPHRDDFAFLLDGRDARDFGSQGQQRCCVLALRLAEVAFMRDATGEPPVLLLDDLVSELDAGRRAAFFAALPEGVQVIATATDAEALRTHAPGARVVVLEGGRVVLPDREDAPLGGRPATS